MADLVKALRRAKQAVEFASDLALDAERHIPETEGKRLKGVVSDLRAKFLSTAQREIDDALKEIEHATTRLRKEQRL